MQSIKDEMKKAVANRCKRAALGSIVRRNYAEIKRMNGEERIRFLRRSRFLTNLWNGDKQRISGS